MFSHKHDCFCHKKDKVWLTGYSWHSRRAGRAKVGTEVNLHLFVPWAASGAALHMAGHLPTVPVCPYGLYVLNGLLISQSFSKTVSSAQVSEVVSISLCKTALRW